MKYGCSKQTESSYTLFYLPGITSHHKNKTALIRQTILQM